MLYDDPDDLEDGKPLVCEGSAEFNAYRNILHTTLDSYESLEEVKLLEDVYQIDVSTAFERYNAIALGIPGMRLDLFYPEYSESQDSESGEILEEKKQ